MSSLKRIFGKGKPAVPVGMDRAGGASPSGSFWAGAVTVPVPQNSTSELDEEGTVILRPPHFPDGIVRLTLLSFRSKDPQPGAGRGQVRKDGKKRGIAPIELDETTVLIYDEPARESDVPLDIRYWIVGGHEQLCIISCTAPQKDRNSIEVGQLLREVDTMARELKFSQRFEYIETAAGGVHARSESVPNPTDQAVRPPSSKDMASIDAMSHLGGELLDRYTGDHAGKDVFLRMDLAFAEWLNDTSADRMPPKDAIDAFGILFGELLNRRFRCEWVIITDEYGTSLAVRHEKSQATAFPVESVRKRYEDHQVHFFDPIRVIFERTINGESNQ